jgi:hypothetical protein
MLGSTASEDQEQSRSDMSSSDLFRTLIFEIQK